MSASLIERQRAMVELLLQGGDASQAGRSGLQGLAGVGDLEQDSRVGGLERGMLAYRLNAQALAARSLRAVFGRIEQVLGEDALAAMAWSFWRQAPPQRGDLGLWGERLPEFLAEQDGMDQSLVDLARLEWAAHSSERAADSELDTASMALLSEVDPQNLSLVFRPGLCLLQVHKQAWQLWSGQTPCSTGDATEYVVMARKAWRAEGQSLQAGAWGLMHSLLAGEDLDQALSAAFDAQADFDFSAWLQAALLNGWLLAAVGRAKHL